ncbi:hypothetical protein MGSAQ_001630, partial [marine sediment metagenome]
RSKNYEPKITVNTVTIAPIPAFLAVLVHRQFRNKHQKRGNNKKQQAYAKAYVKPK